MNHAEILILKIVRSMVILEHDGTWGFRFSEFDFFLVSMVTKLSGKYLLYVKYVHIERLIELKEEKREVLGVFTPSLSRITCDDEEERASRRVYRGCIRSPTCKGCTSCVCFGCDICRFSDCSCQTCIDFTRNAKT
ncbi:hypothetical protein CUMW_166330 [Citrus unshiu]|nr:hypothetical protein CUMW_166330 [Citrus unshiu]